MLTREHQNLPVFSILGTGPSEGVIGRPWLRCHWVPDGGLGGWIGGKAQAGTRINSASYCGQLDPVVSSLITIILGRKGRSTDVWSLAGSSNW